MIILDEKLSFPDPNYTDSYGLLALGGDLSTQRLLLAYRSGIFPWYSDGEPIYWWSPDPRMIFDLRAAQPMRISKSLKQSRRNRGYEIRENTCFTQVMKECASIIRKGELGTWINDEMITAYSNFHELGHAHSIEVFLENELVGGLYGVDLKGQGVFCGESMFSKATDASKIALWYLTEKLIKQNYKLIDAQVYNGHLASLGAMEMDRSEFLTILESL